jgi:hypothetical protein
VFESAGTKGCGAETIGALVIGFGTEVDPIIWTELGCQNRVLPYKICNCCSNGVGCLFSNKSSGTVQSGPIRQGFEAGGVRTGLPIENAFAESFNRRLRDECLNTNWFLSLKHARDVIEGWRTDYNEVRPHSSSKGKTPREYGQASAGFYYPVILRSG